MAIEHYYSGDKNWVDFVEIAKQSSTMPQKMQKSLFEILINNEDIAFVIYYKMLNSSVAWLSRKIPALDKLTPLECLENPELINRLKECLMRMP